MAKIHFGISIQGDRLSGVAIEQHGKRVRVLSCAETVFSGIDHFAEEIEQLRNLLGIKQASGLLGLPLSMLSVRNLEFPFSDTKKIGQALPFELDDQLLQPIDEMVTDFSVIESVGDYSQVLAFASDKESLRILIEQMASSGIEPYGVAPAVVAIAETVGRQYRSGWNLVLQTDTASVSMVLIYNGVCRFCRRLAYPEEMVLQPPFSFEQGKLKVVDMQGAEACMQAVASSVGRSLGFLKLSGLPVDKIEQVLVTGVMAGDATMLSFISGQLGIDVSGAAVASSFDAEITEQCVEPLRNGRFEAALCLAFQGRGGKASYNLRQGGLAAKRKLFTSRRQLVACAASLLSIPVLLMGFYLYDQGRLKRKSETLRSDIVKIYRTAFPGATRIQDPYSQMKVALRELEASGAAVPTQSGRQGTLDYLADISARLPETLPLQVSRMVIDNQAVRIRGVTENFNRVDEIKNRLSSSPYYLSVQIMSATADKKTSKIRFEIQLLLGGT